MFLYMYLFFKDTNTDIDMLDSKFHSLICYKTDTEYNLDIIKTIFDAKEYGCNLNLKDMNMIDNIKLFR